MAYSCGRRPPDSSASRKGEELGMQLRSSRVRTVSMVALALWVLASRCLAEEVPTLEALKQEQPGFFVRASVDHPDGKYYQGDALSISVKCGIDAYLYVVYQQADGKNFQIFPNSQQSDNHVRGGQAVTIPASDDTF